MPYCQQGTRQLTTTASVYQNTSDFTCAQLFGDLTGSRIVTARWFRFTFGPTTSTTASGNVPADVAVMITAYDPVTATHVPISSVFTLNEAKPTIINCRIPPGIARSYGANNTAVVCRVNVYNVFASSTVSLFTCTVCAHCTLYEDFPASI
jgi:hypothetical protein